jgi:hypothetical protein
MDVERIETALDVYFQTHHYSRLERLELNVWYPIKEFQKDRMKPFIFSYYESRVRVIPCLLVTSLVVSPREDAA